MASKLNPPYIEGKLPAQVDDILTIPFQHNRSVGLDDYNKFSLIIKTINTNSEVGRLESDGHDASFDLKQLESKLNIGQYYKVQLAYIGQDKKIGYYSTAGVFKYTDQPVISLQQIQDVVRATYNCPDSDSTEKLYSYRFDFYDASGKFIESSGDKIYNNITDTHMSYTFTSLQVNKVKLTTTSVNDLIREKIQNVSPLNLGISSVNCVAKNLSEEGCISLSISSGFSAGTYKIYRCEPNTITTQMPIKRYDKIFEGQLSKGSEGLLFKDYTAIQGVYYWYVIKGSTECSSNIVYSDFEYAFLYDGEKQLKLKFDTKMSSFKTTILESKLDTIGGQFPFFFRNGNTAYKTFPLTALLTYHLQDTAESESKRVNTNSTETFTATSGTNLSADNFARERQFKLETLNWLNNGQPKLFRSPSEGNYLVRLMNVSLSPEEQLGRMIHRFSCDANEIAEVSYANLKEYGICK